MFRITEVEKEKLIDAFHNILVGYQNDWFEAGLKYHFRNILCSRMVGSTLFFSLEGLVHALETGENQVFISDTKEQVDIYRDAITSFFKEKAGIHIQNEKIVLPNKAQLYFLDLETGVPEDCFGNVYVDEYFWSSDFLRLNKSAQIVSIKGKFRRTFFSTFSNATHDAYPFWSSSNDPWLDQVDVVMSKGKLCGDGQWRHIVTAEDAVRKGCYWLKPCQLEEVYTPDEFKRLYMCDFTRDYPSKKQTTKDF